MRGVVRRSVRATSPLAGEGVTRSVTDEDLLAVVKSNERVCEPARV